MKGKPQYVYQVLLITKLRNRAYSSEEVGITLDLELAKNKLKDAWNDATKCYARQIELEGYEKIVEESQNKCSVTFKYINGGIFDEDLYQKIFIREIEIK